MKGEKSDVRHINIPIFIPHMGCPNMCVFCNQRSISGRLSFDISRVEAEIETSLSTVSLEDEVVVEQFIEGREFSIGVIDGKALPIIEIAPLQGFYDYKNKYQAGSAIETCPAQISEDLTKRMQAYAEAAYKALGMQAYARIDFLTNKQEEIFCLEANTLPGMTPTSLLPQEAAVLGINFNELCEKLIEVSLAKYN